MNSVPAKYEAIHRALLTGLLSSVGKKDEKSHEYLGARSNKFSLFPGSGIFKKQPRFVVSAELVKTTKLYARCNAGVLPEWIESVGHHLLKRSFSDPHWDERSERVLAYEQVTLYGLELFSKRRVHYGPIDPGLCRDLFVTAALVEGNMRSGGAFVEHNRRLMDRAIMLQTRFRRTDLIADPTVRYAFFERKLPKDVYAGTAFERWRLDAEKVDPLTLHFSDREVLSDAARQLSLDDYPDSIDLGTSEVPVPCDLQYINDPQSNSDGITAIVPLGALSGVQPHMSSWLVDGFVVEKIEAILRQLPKSVRTMFVPAGQYAPQALAEINRAALTKDAGFSLSAALAQALTAVSPIDVTRAMVDEAERATSEHLKMNFRVIDAEGHTLGESRDLFALRRSLQDRIAEAIERLAPPELSRDGLAGWDFGDLSESVLLSDRKAGIAVRAYPGLVLIDGRVGLRVFATPLGAQQAHRLGLRRLFSLKAKDALERAVGYLPNLSELRVLHATIGSAKQLHQSLLARMAEQCFVSDDALVRERAEFEARIMTGIGKADNAARTTGALFAGILSLVQQTLLEIERHKAPAHIAAVLDVKEQLESLLHPGFLHDVPWAWLTHYPRYLQAIAVRLRKLTASGGSGLDKDERAMQDVAPRWEVYLVMRNAIARHPGHGPDPELETYRWMLEEFRVQCFAQELGTAIAVSAKKLDMQWGRVRAIG